MYIHGGGREEGNWRGMQETNVSDMRKCDVVVMVMVVMVICARARARACVCVCMCVLLGCGMIKTSDSMVTWKAGAGVAI